MNNIFMLWIRNTDRMQELLSCNSVEDIKRMFMKYMYPEKYTSLPHAFVAGAKQIQFDKILKYVQLKRGEE